MTNIDPTDHALGNQTAPEDEQAAVTVAYETVGISPKVYVPALGQIIVGVVLIILGLDVEGRTAIATGLGTFAVGFGAKPGQVAQRVVVNR